MLLDGGPVAGEEEVAGQSPWGLCRGLTVWPSGSKGTSWVASVHFPNQIEIELLLFPGSIKGFWKTRAGRSLSEEPRPTFFPAPVLPSRGRLRN